MNDRAVRFFNETKDKRVAFIGIGVSNTDTIKLFLSQGIRTIACDRRDREQLGAVCGELEALGAELRLGESYLENLGADIAFRTPGMYFYSEEIKALRRDGVAVTSEMEVFFSLCPCKTFAITGSDGKTTTTAVIAEMLKAQGHTVHLGGNIGKALLPEIFDISPDDFAVVELSSFQLISMRFAPTVSIITNVTPNHLDVHSGMEEYIEAKKNIFLHQDAFSRTVLNVCNEVTKDFAREVRGECRIFSLSGEVRNGAYEKDGVIYDVSNGIAKEVMRSEDIRLPGRHNVDNYLAAISAVSGYVDYENIKKVAEEFGGVEHRIQFIRELNGVKWYNDSIATSPTRVIAGLRSFDRELIIIAGGYDKKIPFEPMAADVIEHVKLLILTGPTAAKIEAAVKGHPGFDGSPVIVHAKDLADAVRIAYERSADGDIVSLSPACASFDAYPNFEARGRHYVEIVNSLCEK